MQHSQGLHAPRKRTKIQLDNDLSLLLESEQLVVEGSGAVSVAALLFDKVGLRGKKVVAVISGGNIDIELLLEITQQSLSRRAGL